MTQAEVFAVSSEAHSQLFLQSEFERNALQLPLGMYITPKLGCSKSGTSETQFEVWHGVLWLHSGWY